MLEPKKSKYKKIVRFLCIIIAHISNSYCFTGSSTEIFFFIKVSIVIKSFKINDFTINYFFKLKV